MVRRMRDLLILAIHLIVTVVTLLRPGGVRAVAAESLLLKHQLVIINRNPIFSHYRAIPRAGLWQLSSVLRARKFSLPTSIRKCNGREKMGLDWAGAARLVDAAIT